MEVDLFKKFEEFKQARDRELEEIDETIKYYQQQKEERSEFEKKLYDNFCANVKENKYHYFKIDHVNKLGLNYNFLIFLSSKNSGKTTEQYRLMKETIEKGKKFFYLRTMKSEIEGLIHQFDNDEQCPVKLLKSAGRYLIYSKSAWEYIIQSEQIKKDITTTPKFAKSVFDKYNIKEVGYVIDFHNSNSIGGASYPDVELIIYDECLSHHPTVKTKKHHCSIFQKAISSIQRSKEPVQVLCFGNLTKNTALLEYYGITPLDNFRYISHQDPQSGESTGNLIFINATDIYGGSFKNQKGAVQMGDPIETLKQIKNATIYDHDLVRGKEVWEYAEQIVKINKGGFFMEVRKIKSPTSKKWAYIVNLNNSSLLTKDTKVYVDSLAHKKNQNHILVKNCIDKISFLFGYYEIGKVFFCTDDALNVFDALYNDMAKQKNNWVLWQR